MYWHQKSSLSRCSKGRQSVTLHNSRRRLNDWRNRSKISGIVFTQSAATIILAKRSLAVPTAIRIPMLSCTPLKRLSGFRSGQCEGHVRPILWDTWHGWKVGDHKWAISICVFSVTSCTKPGCICSRKTRFSTLVISGNG